MIKLQQIILVTANVSLMGHGVRKLNVLIFFVAEAVIILLSAYLDLPCIG